MIKNIWIYLIILITTQFLLDKLSKKTLFFKILEKLLPCFNEGLSNLCGKEVGRSVCRVTLMVSCIRIYIRSSAERTRGRGRGRNKRAATSEENVDLREWKAIDSRWLTRWERRYINLVYIRYKERKKGEKKRRKEIKKERRKEGKKERRKKRTKKRKKEEKKERRK